MLAATMREYRGVDGLVVLGLPRGGVPVADEVAQALGAPLDVLLVRKIGVPGHPEVAMGAIASLGNTIETVTNAQFGDEVRAGGALAEAFTQIAAAEGIELRRRQRTYRGDREPLDLRDRVVVLVDDGLATGSTMQAAISAARRADPAKVVVSVPVAVGGGAATVRGLADDVICEWEADHLYAVGAAYEHFDQTTDDEVGEILTAADRRRQDGHKE